MKYAVFRSLMLALASALIPFSAVSQPARKVVAFTDIIEHPALEAVREGVISELRSVGYEEGRNLKIVYQSANGDPEAATKIARRFAQEQPDVIVAISTPSAQAAVQATKTIPVVYSAVTDPVAAKLVQHWAASGTNVTGVSDLSPLDKHVALIKRVVPGVKRLGVLFSPSEVNSVSILAGMKKAAADAGIVVVESAAQRSVDVSAATRALIGKVDAIYAPADNNVATGIDSIVRVAERSKLPVIAAEAGMVERGAVAAVGLNYRDLGYQTGKIVVRVLKGEKPGEIASQTSTRFELVVNPGVAKQQGVRLADDLVREARVISCFRF